MSVILKEESGQFTLSIAFESAESLESFSDIYTEEYFEVLGLLEPSGQQEVVVGGSTVVVEDTKPGYVNRYLANLYNQFAPLFQYDTKELMSTKPPVKKPLIVTEPLKEITEPVTKITESVKEIAEPVIEITEPVKEITEPVTEITQPVKITEPVKKITESVTEITEPVTENTEPLKWEIKLTKKWETLVLTEQEFIEMKKNNIKSDNLEQDKDGLTRPEKVYLEKMEKIQFSYKKSLQKTNLIDFSLLPEIKPSAFYICPRDSPFYIRLSFRHL